MFSLMFSVVVLFVALVANRKIIGPSSKTETNINNFVYYILMVAFLLNIVVFLFSFLVAIKGSLEFDLEIAFGVSLMVLSFIIYIVTDVYSNRYETLKTEMLIIKISIRFYFWVGVIFLGSSFLYPNLLILTILNLI